MPSVSAFQRVKWIKFEWPDSAEVLNLKVYPDHFTGASLEGLEARLEATGNEKETTQHKFLCDFLASMIGEWDLTDDNGSTIPITGESLFTNLPVTLVVGLLDSIKSELQVNPQKPES